MCIRADHLFFLDSIPFLPFALHKVPEAFGPSLNPRIRIISYADDSGLCRKNPDVSYYGIDEMSECERVCSSLRTNFRRSRSSITDESWNSIVSVT